MAQLRGVHGRGDPSTLARQRELAHATSEELTALAAASERLVLAAGRELYAVGDEATHVYFIESGYLTNQLPRPGRRPVVFGFGGPRQGSWGARDVYAGSRRITRSVAAVPTTVLAIPADALEAHFQSNQRSLREAVAWFAHLVRILARQTGEIGPVEVRRRLCHLLVVDFTDGDNIELPISITQLAELMGVSRATVSSSLSAMVRRGWLEPRGASRFRLVDRAAVLRAIEPLAGDVSGEPALVRGVADTGLSFELERVRRVPLLSGASDAHAARFAAACRVLSVESGTSLVSQEVRDDRVVVLLAGRAGSWLRFLRHRGQRLRTVDPLAEVLGAEQLFSQTAAPTDIVAESRCSVAVASREALADLVAAEVHLPREVLRQVSRQVQALAEVRASLSEGSTVARLARALLVHADGTQDAAQLPNQQELADALAVSRQTVNSALGELRRAGLVETARGAGSRIVDPAGLAERAGLA